MRLIFTIFVIVLSLISSFNEVASSCTIIPQLALKLQVMNNQTEIWNDIPEYEGLYLASSFGRIKSLDMYVNHAGSGRAIRKGRILKGGINNVGYKIVTLCKNKTRRSKAVHQLIAMSFLNHTPDGYNLVIDHIDHDKLNNNLNNIRIVTHRENISHQKRKLSSKYPGVSFHKRANNWRARVQVNNKKIHLGCFDNEIDACNIYKEALESIELGCEIRKINKKYSSKYKGVSWNKQKNKWSSKIWLNNKCKNIGLYINEYEAHLAYENELKKII